MSNFLNKSIAPPLMLAGVLAMGATFTWLTAVLAPIAVFEPWLPDIRVLTALYGCVISILLLSPLLVAIVLFGWVPLSEWYWSWNSGQPIPLTQFVAPILVVCAASAILAHRCFHRHQRFSDHGAIAWAVFVFVWGLPGFVGYLLHRRWPVMEVCRQCAKESPRDRDACLHCGAAFPPPELKGTEVFA